MRGLGLLLSLGMIIIAPNPSAASAQNVTSDTIVDTSRGLPGEFAAPIADAGCINGEENRSSALCAQWKAADVAEKAAWWAGFAGWFGGLSFLGVVVAIWLTIRSNSIARDTAQRQLRAYVSVIGSTIDTLDDGSGFLLQAVLRNDGATPAYDVEIMGETFDGSYPIDERVFVPRHLPRKSIMGPGNELACPLRIIGSPLETIAAVKNREIGLYIHGVCRYNDAFGVARFTRFRYVYGGRTSELGLIMHADRTGNEAN